MAVPNPGNMIRWHLEPEDESRAAILNNEQRMKLQTMNVELAEAIADYPFEASNVSGALLDAPNFWMLKGRRGLVIQLLEEHDAAIGASKSPSPSDESDNQTQPQPRSF